MNILLTGAFNYSPQQLKQLSRLGLNITYLQYENDGLPDDASTYDMVVCNALFLYHDITAFTSLKYIQLTSAGYDRVPINHVTDRGILINNARGVYNIPMAEWTVGRILEYYKAFREFDLSQKQCDWKKNRHLRELYGASVAIIGSGNIGQEVAKRLTCFGTIITGYDIVLTPKDHFTEIKHINELDSHIQDYDIVILTAPYTSESHHLLNEHRLGKLKEGAVLVNISRGALIDTNALCNTLSQRSDVYAALDVFEEEPLSSNHVLWSLPNVAISPHNSFVSDGNNSRLFTLIYDNLQNFIERNS